MNRQRLGRTMWQPLDPDWETDALSRFVFGPPTLAHVLTGVVIALLVAILYVVAG